MGMAASQARFLGLTARKNNVEYEGQQITQQRTTLGNQSANYYNDLLGMAVPVPPSVDNYTYIPSSENNIKPPKSIKSDNAMSDDDKNFFAQPLTYSSIKRWCSKNGFVCSKYLVERTR